MSIHGPILRQLLRHPFTTAIIDDARSYRGIDLFLAAMHVAGAIQEKSTGQTPSQTIGVMVPTSGAFPIAALAGWMLGKVVVPLNYLLKREELQYVIDDCGCDCVVSATPLLTHMGYEPSVKHLLRMDTIDFRSFPPVVPFKGAEDSDLGVLLYTSGTSGKPKGVMLTHGNITANIAQCAEWINIRRDFVLLGVLPQFHSFGLTVLTLLPLTVGCKAVYTARFMPSRLVKLMREHRPTVFIAIPSMYNALLSVKDAGPEDFSSFKYVVSGGEPLPDAVAQRMADRFGVTISEGYGLTETAPVSNWCRPFEFKPHSVGKPLRGIHQRITDPATGATLGPNQDGEVQMRGPNIMRGYYRLPEETRAAFTSDGYFKTGDMGRHDLDGHLFITGRIKEMLIVGGENVFPREIEEVLNKHESVNASGVVGKIDPMRGEVPVAFVEMKDGAAFDQTALRQHCRASLAGYKVPEEVRVLEELPRNATGKVLRRELKKLV